MEIKDLIVIGGGINGVGIVVDVVGCGLFVFMLEVQDLVCVIFFVSLKFIYGGLCYFEYYEFCLVSEVLVECEVLLKMVLYIVFLMCFCLLYCLYLCLVWMICIGLFMYDYFGKCISLFSFIGVWFGVDLVFKLEIVCGFEYFDCWVDDVCLVLVNVQMVVCKGGEVFICICVIVVCWENGLWIVEVEDIDIGKKYVWQVCGLVNVIGLWVKQFFDEGMYLLLLYGICLIKGSYIVVLCVYNQKQVYIL